LVSGARSGFLRRNNWLAVILDLSREKLGLLEWQWVVVYLRGYKSVSHAIVDLGMDGDEIKV
jgi:hypothetical protein